MSPTTCSDTGLHLVPASGQVGVRVSLSSVTALGVLPRETVPSGRIVVEGTRQYVLPWDEQPPWGRWDTLGRTLYVGETRRSAYAEVLQQFKEPLNTEPLQRMADAMGMTLARFAASVDADWTAVGAMPRGQFSQAWREARTLYQVRLPADGWWIDIEHGDTLAALSAAVGPMVAGLGYRTGLTRADVLGEDRVLTCALAEHLRPLILFDGSLPLGITWESKLGFGRNWAFWMRRADDGLDLGDNDPAEVGASAIDAHDDDLMHVAHQFGLRIH